ncbi:PREDICTED: uncharacterized protein LOC107191894 [Dufourea novaeangliae]|uniref:uncharacterized protein LOC107191894 n=1 Tax=Dufourea novaeangliae TaxID=178035 RepID=UPI000766E380|nr:PREDICTED: uncharacterized protein LOC107191894 [Dufourea novaeangliae]
MIGARSLYVLIYKLFFKQYAFDPVIIELEEKENKEKCNSLDEVLGTLSMTSLMYSLYCHHKYHVLGAFVITNLTVLDIMKLWKTTTTESQVLEIDTSEIYYTSMEAMMYMSKSAIFMGVLISGYFAYSVGNNYALVANYPYLLTTWALTPEGFYQGWTIQRTINDYMMMAYVICMTEALRQTPRP